MAQKYSLISKSIGEYSRVEQDVLNFLDLVYFDLLVSLLVSKILMSRFFPVLKIFISKFFILSCFKKFILKSWHSWPATGQQYVILGFKEILGTVEIANIILRYKAIFFEWILKKHFSKCVLSWFFLDSWYFFF